MSAFSASPSSRTWMRSRSPDLATSTWPSAESTVTNRVSGAFLTASRNLRSWTASRSLSFRRSFPPSLSMSFR
jgi:hypothetical protein